MTDARFEYIRDCFPKVHTRVTDLSKAYVTMLLSGHEENSLRIRGQLQGIAYAMADTNQLSDAEDYVSDVILREYDRRYEEVGTN